MNKYYLPKLEEFHVGFTYEFRTPKYNDWEKEELTNEGFNVFDEWVDDLLKTDSIRVKYLDEIDLEDLNIILRSEGNDNVSLYINEDKIGSFKYDNNSNITKLHIKDILFPNIKNKFELNKVLKLMGYEKMVKNDI